jgi:hypothetical protein
MLSVIGVFHLLQKNGERKVSRVQPTRYMMSSSVSLSRYLSITAISG